MAGFKKRSLGGLWRSAAAIATVLGFSTPVETQAQTQAPRLTPQAAPEAWVVYAETATAAVTAWLEEDVASSVRLHLDQMRLEPDQPSLPLELKLWIDDEGRVSRIGFTPFDQPQVDEDIRTVIMGRRLAPPPHGMLQPLRLEIQLSD
ncbi:hypothetical protein D3C73_1092620 [compost metagenome]